MASACSIGLWQIILRADFYHLTQIPLDRALPAIAERVLAAGEQLLILAKDEKTLDQLDQQLWTFRADSFLPHGRDGNQPILLAQTAEGQGGYPNIAYADGQWRDPPAGCVRVFYFFDPTQLEGARAAWRALASTPIERHYWKQDDAGRWREGP